MLGGEWYGRVRRGEPLTLKFDIPMDDALGMKVGDRADELGENAADEGWREKGAMASRHVKEISAGVVTENEDGAGWLDVPCLEVYERWVPY